MKPYESYKETNIPWVKEIPSHWIFLRNKNVLSEQKDTVGENSSNYTLLSLTLNGVIKRDMVNAKGKFPKDFDTYKIVKNGDIIFCLFDIDETPRTVGLSKHNGMITGAYDVFHIENINPQYLYYYYLSIDNAKAMKPLYTGLRKVIGVPTFLGTKLPVPPRSEQDQIVRYLDWQLSKINKLIKAKKKQIGLLNEQKQAIINKAVTKGLDDTVPMKDSGVDWIGEIPKSWIKFQLGKCTQIILSGLDKKSYEGQKEVLLCNYVDAYKNDYITEDINFMKATASDVEIANLKIVSGDVIITKDSESWDDIGVAAYVPKDIDNLFCAYHLAILRTNKNILLGEFLYNAFRSQYVQIQHKIKAKGVTRFALGYQPIHDTFLYIPPINEQISIVERINNDCRIQNQYIKNLKNELDLLTEYKTSIISSVVTGKVDVRDIEIPDFEIDDDQQNIDEIEDTDDVEELEVE